MAKFIIVVIECCLQLSFASSCGDPVDLIVTVLFMMDLLMKYFSISVCQPCVDLWTLIAVYTYKRHQKLKQRITVRSQALPYLLCVTFFPFLRVDHIHIQLILEVTLGKKTDDTCDKD
jgi:hypothetical protein